MWTDAGGMRQGGLRILYGCRRVQRAVLVPGFGPGRLAWCGCLAQWTHARW